MFNLFCGVIKISKQKIYPYFVACHFNDNITNFASKKRSPICFIQSCHGNSYPLLSDHMHNDFSSKFYVENFILLFLLLIYLMLKACFLLMSYGSLATVSIPT